jgi:hypothetical protein
MDFKRHFHNEILRSCPAARFADLQADIEARYAAIYPDVAFARTSSNPVDRRLVFCGYVLATIQALEARGATFEQIRRACVDVTESYVRPASAWQRWWKRLPPRLIGTPLTRIIARIMAAKTGRKGHENGFLVRIVTAPDETYGLGYGFDILECSICTLFRKHGALAYVPILCEVERITSSLVGLELVREGTLATGAAKCDFRFKMLRSSKQPSNRSSSAASLSPGAASGSAIPHGWTHIGAE